MDDLAKDRYAPFGLGRLLGGVAASIYGATLRARVLRPREDVAFMWGRLAACGGLVTRLERRLTIGLTIGAQLIKLPHQRTSYTVRDLVERSLNFQTMRGPFKSSPSWARMHRLPTGARLNKPPHTAS